MLTACVPSGVHPVNLYNSIESAKRAGVEPWAYLRDLLVRIDSHPGSRIRELLPCRWKPTACRSSFGLKSTADNHRPISDRPEGVIADRLLSKGDFRLFMLASVIPRRRARLAGGESGGNLSD